MLISTTSQQLLTQSAKKKEKQTKFQTVEMTLIAEFH
jgi:hypothetical protein